MSKKENEICVVLCTCPDHATAERLAEGLVDAAFAACVNIVPEIRSVFRWEGKLERESESLMIIKSSRARLGTLESWLGEHHPYDVPEVLVLPVAGGSQAYLSWVASELA